MPGRLFENHPDDTMQLRATNLARLPSDTHDVLIVGGGINGAVSAAALAARGAKVALIDRGDFACGTSQESSNLAWGGIKYMESYEFPLVRGLCMSRNELMRSYPSSVREIRFLTTIGRGFRQPTSMIWAGTWMYWLIGNCHTQPPRRLSRRQLEAEEPVVDTSDFGGCLEYSDAYLHDNDARFVFGFVRSALDRGATVGNYVSAEGSQYDGRQWLTRARDTVSGSEIEIRSRTLVNAAGAWVDEFNRASQQTSEHHHVFSKGIHLIVPRVSRGHRVLAFFADDGRLFFVIPMGARTCLGTTDTPVGAPETGVTDDDRRFVLDNINRRLRLERPLTPADVIAERCGVRPLAVRGDVGYDGDFLKLSRRHAIDVDRERCHLSIFGGKLTDCLNVGDEVCDLLAEMGVTLDRSVTRWYGEPGAEEHAEFLRRAASLRLDERTVAGAAEPLSQRLWRRYGSRSFNLLDRIAADATQGEVLIEGTEYLRCEIEETAEREMIVKLEDFLRRRSKIALVTRRDDMRAAPGLMRACEMLFGDDAQTRFDEYFLRNA